jgi:transcriptional regulator with XRE-family HTH domain
MSHWTQGGVSDFVYNISLDFFTQVEDRIHEAKLPQKELAERLSVSPSAVSQILNSPPEKPALETLVKYARAIGSKVSVVLYDDDDPANERGPVYSGIFEQSWRALDKPRDLDAVKEAKSLLDFSMIGFSMPATAKVYGGGYIDNNWTTVFSYPEYISSTFYAEAKQYQQPFGYGLAPGNRIQQDWIAISPDNILTQSAPQEEEKEAA